MLGHSDRDFTMRVNDARNNGKLARVREVRRRIETAQSDWARDLTREEIEVIVSEVLGL